MKHGRPNKQWYEFCGKQYHLCRSSDGLGWRREHAARVFQAIQANVMAMSAFVCGIAAGNLSAGDMDLDIEAAEQSMRNCGWGSLLED